MVVDILVLGATGFTGRLITRYLASHPQRNSFTFAIGVRSKTKGVELLKSLGIENDGTVRVVEVDVTRYESVEAAVRDTKVVINTVGPFWLWGTSVVRACALLGRRYVDLTGEPQFVRKIIELFDHIATKTGAVIVPSCGFDSLPSDLAVFLSNRTLKNAIGPQTQLGLSQTFFDIKSGISGGSLATLATEIEEVPQILLAQSRQDYALSPVKGYPSPPFQKAVRVPFSSPPAYGAFWIMANVNRAIVQRTFGLNELLANYSGALLTSAPVQETAAQIRPLTYGPEFRYAEYMTVGTSRLVASVSSTLLGVWLALLFYVPPIWWFVKLFLPKSGEGPSEHQLKTGYMTVTNFTEAASAPGTWAKTTIHGKGDPGYLLTAGMISECALALALDDASLPPHARLGGVLTPATALGSDIVSRLEASSLLHFESQIVRGQEESRKDR
ncbi:Saccharopine dehydrogenase-domain-containing protein [Dichomitus squalens]|uniref:Saccharopine dehydrogenase-domain-containing protein n=1 Tax=Dichomitus squalens TaxID=114155 RepID=A0A4Q9MLG3_9APHY|nr:Saccharopine dehydrogenase-domain-containing protein [Dichomitus squalens]